MDISQIPIYHQFNNGQIINPNPFIINLMHSKKPVELSQKIDYLNQKISRVHWETRNSDDFQLRLNFQEYIDNCINIILNIKDKSVKIVNKPSQSNQSSPGKLYSVEKEKLEIEKKMMFFQMQEIQQKQKELEYDSLKVQLLTKEKQHQNYRKENEQKRREFIKDFEIKKGRCQFLEQEIEKLVGLNKAQNQQIERQRKERNRAEIKYLQLQQKYQQELGVLEKFGEKTPKYLDRSTEGMKCTKYFTNVSKGDGKGAGQKLIMLKLPIVIQVNKIVYGVTLGLAVNKAQILYYDKFQLFQKELAQISVEGSRLVVEYKKRKTNARIVLDRYQVRGNEIVVQLFGRGDSIIVHE